MIEDYNAWVSQAHTALATGQYSTAISLCEKVLMIEQKNIEALTIAGSSAIALDIPDKAEAFFQKAVAISPQNGELHFMHGNALFGQQKISEALHSYAKAERYGCCDESKKKLYYLMGLINQVQGQSKAALANYKKSLLILGANADRVDIFLKCVQLYVEIQNFDEAENYARQIMLLKPEEFKSYELLFQILLQEQKIDEAFGVLTEAENICSEEYRVDIALYRSLLYCVLAEIDTEGKMEYYMEALNLLTELDASEILVVKRLEVILAKAELYLKLKDISNSKKMAEQTLQFKYSEELIDYFDKAHFILLECLKSEGVLDESLEHAIELKKSKNGFYRSHGLYSVAWLTKKQTGTEAARKLYAEAIAFYRTNTARNPADMISYSYRIRAYTDIGEKSKARELCNILPDEMRREMEMYINNVHS